MQYIPYLSLLGPLALLPPGLLPRGYCNRHSRALGFTAETMAWLALCGTVAGSAGMLVRPAYGFGIEGLPFLLYGGMLTAVLPPLVAMLTVVVIRYSRVYLQGQADRGGFIKWLCATSASVQVFLLTGNLLIFALAWVSMSLALHHLLTFYPDRPGALLAARKKFLISRIGDLCIAGALAAAYRAAGTWDMATLFHHAAQASAAGRHPHLLSLAGLLITIAALLKSAQFPFHTWLPDTMEAPTPVSAFMHAGIINAGGFLVLRMAPLVALSHTAQWLLVIVGGATAVGGSLVKLTQTSVKRSLGFSTVAQMGFMLMECGLGAFGLALLHIVAHALYKAYAFLYSGQLDTQRANNRTAPAGVAWLRAVMATGLCGMGLWAWHILSQSPPAAAPTMLNVIIDAGLLFLAWHIARHSRSAVGGVLAVFLPLSLAILHTTLAAAGAMPGAWSVSMGPVLIVGTLFLLLILVETLALRFPDHPLARKMYMLIYNGFYLNALANRLVISIWPVQQLGETPHDHF
jgi:NAD(P)H-quinone oxidoreductase subunit 5